MIVLSTRLEMVESFSEVELFDVACKWLISAGPCKPIGEELLASENKLGIKLECGYSRLETFEARRDDCEHYLIKHEQVFHEQTWTTELILRILDDERSLFIHLDCSRDISRFDEVPQMRTEVVRAFVNSGFVKNGLPPVCDKPIEAEGLEGLLVSAVREEYSASMPIVLVTRYFDSMGYAVDEYGLARSLAGIAAVLVCDSEYTGLLKERTGARPPYNGAVAIYSANGKPRIYRGTDSFGGELDKEILKDAQRLVTAAVGATAPTWKQLHVELVEEREKEKALLLDVAFDENESLEDRLRHAMERISALVEENRILRSKNEALELALDRGDGECIIKKAPGELYEGEENDLILSSLRIAQRGYGPDTRAYELSEKLLEANAEVGIGKEILAVVKNTLSEGRSPRETDLARLRSVGFEVVADANHYKLRFAGSEKYWFTLSKTPSDVRSGLNTVSDVVRMLSVYK